MDISEQLIKAAKNGNAKEVRKLLSRGAVFTKDEVSKLSIVQRIHALSVIVWKHSSSRGIMDGQPRHRQDTAEG